MRGRFGEMLAAAALAGGSACAMSPPAPAEGIACRVVDGTRLQPGSGGADALCAAIERAASAQAPRAAATIEIRVLSPSRLTATVTTSDGRTLPEQSFASNDRPLTRSSFQRFADAIAAALAAATER